MNRCLAQHSKLSGGISEPRVYALQCVLDDGHGVRHEDTEGDWWEVWPAEPELAVRADEWTAAFAVFVFLVWGGTDWCYGQHHLVPYDGGFISGGKFHHQQGCFSVRP